MILQLSVSSNQARSLEYEYGPDKLSPVLIANSTPPLALPLAPIQAFIILYTPAILRCHAAVIPQTASLPSHATPDTYKHCGARPFGHKRLEDKEDK